MRLQVNDTVKAGLLEESAMSSDETMGLSSNTATEKMRGSNDLTDTICEYNNFLGSSEVAQQQLASMEKEQARQEKTEMKLEADHLHKKHKKLFEEWE